MRAAFLATRSGVSAERRRIGPFNVASTLNLLAAFCVAVASSHPVNAATFSQPYISEVLINNQSGLKDETGERSPWIEIHNGGSSTINLAGWFLTDSTNELTRWRFPRVGLLPDKQIVVFASGRNRTSDPAHVHTNFRLTTNTSWIGLVDRNTNLVAELPIRSSQLPDISIGRVRGEPAIVGAFSRPTPGKPNTSSGKGFAPEVLFSKTSTTFTSPFTLTLSTRGPATIRYTLDGTLPNGASPTYSAPLQITNTTQVRARAYEPKLLPGPPRSEAFVLVHSNVLHFSSTLPILVIDTFGPEVQTPHGSFANLYFHEPVGGRSSLTNAPALATRGAFHIRGSTSSGMPQSSFVMHFVDEFNDEIPHPALGLPADSDWVLYAPNWYDPVLIHNPFIHQLSRDMGRYSPRTRFVEAFVVRSAGGVRSVHYNGLYVLEERIKIGKNRVNIERIGAEDLKPPKVTGGYLLKFDRLGPGEGGFYSGGPTIVYVEPREQVINLPQRAPQKDYLETYFGNFAQALHGPSWLDPVRGYRTFLDVDAAVDFHVLEVLSGNVDAGVFSTFFHKARNGKIIFGPHWDFDRALGSTDGRDDNPRNWNTGPYFHTDWWGRLCSDPDFWQLWVDRWQDLRQTLFATTNLFALTDRLSGELRDAQPRQYRKWGFQPRGGTYQSEVDLMKDWLSNRVDFIDEQLAQPPRVIDARTGAARKVSLAAAAGATIYYTLDGSDPRLPHGAASSNAVTYTTPIELKQGTRLTARTRDPARRQVGGPPVSTPWSRPVRLE